MEPLENGLGSGLPGGLAPMKLDPQGGDPLVERLFPHLATGVQWGLERMSSFLAATGDPHVGYPILHIGGTNGKGSVASTLASTLSQAGHRVGLYTSPHLCSFTERFQLANTPVGEGELIELAGDLEERAVEHGLTFFEAATALAFHLFARRDVDVVVLEVGLGGRLDATTVATPILTAVTNVALDHSEYLGDGLPDIAREKAGIIKPGVPFVTAESDAGLVELFRRICDEAGAPFRSLDPTADLAELEVKEDHTLFRMDSDLWGGLEVWTPLVGSHHAVNTALAVRVLEGLPEGLRPDRNAVLDGIRSVRWPGRSQIEHIDGQTWLLDVAHNTAGALALAEVVECLPLPRPIVILTGVLGDKDWRSMLPPLFRLADQAILTQPPSAPEERRWDPEQAMRVIGSPCPLELEADFGAAMERARIAAAQGTVVVTGSNHTVGDALEFLDRIPFQTIPSTASSL